MKSAVVDQIFLKSNMADKKHCANPRRILFLSNVIQGNKKTTNDANGIELLHSKKKTTFKSFFPSVTTVAKK